MDFEAEQSEFIESAVPVDPRRQIAENLASRLLSYGDLRERYPHMRSPVIEGVLRYGEIANVIATSKTYKSWLVANLAHAVRCGLPWLGWPTRQGSVLIVDNELHRETISVRCAAVAKAMGIEGMDGLDILPLRGQLTDLEMLSLVLQRFRKRQYSLVIVDALYRMLPKGIEENSNSDMTTMYNTMDGIADAVGGAMAVVHHSSKGDQSGKAQTDVGAGAGAISRACDTHLSLRRHKEDGCVILEATPRSFGPIDPKVLRWQYPLWVEAPDLDPADFLRPNESGKWEPGEDDCEKALEPFSEHAMERAAAMLVLKESLGSERKAKTMLSKLATEGRIEKYSRRRRGVNKVWYGSAEQLAAIQQQLEEEDSRR